jgi:hypothetical protein
VVRSRFEPVLELVTLQTRTIILTFEDEEALLAAVLRPFGLEAAPALGGCGAHVAARYVLAVGRRPD